MNYSTEGPFQECSEYTEKICSHIEKGPTATDLFNVTESGWIWASFGVFSPLCIFGIIGNILTIIMFSRYIKKTTTSVFIISLAIVDLLVCSTTMPIWLYTLLKERQESEFICKLYEFTKFLAIPFSAGILTVIAIDRFLLIFLVRTDLVTKFRAKILVIITGCVCLGLAIPQLFNFTTKRTVMLKGVCEEEFYCNSKICQRSPIASIVYLTPPISATTTQQPLIHKVASKMYDVVLYSLLGIVVGFIVLYSLIFTKVYRMHKKMSSWKSSRKNTPNTTSRVQVDHATFATDCQTNHHNIAPTDNGNSVAVPESPQEVTVQLTTRDNNDSDGILPEEAALMKSDTPPKLSHTEMRPKAKKKRRRLPHFHTAVTLFLVTISFTLAYAPMIIIMFFQLCSKNKSDVDENSYELECPPNTYHYFLFHFYFLNHVTNPIIYSFMNPRFKDAIKMCCKRFSCLIS